MLVLIKLIVLTSIWCLGLQISTSEGMVFYRFREYAETKKSKIWEAIVLCPWCCASVHSIFGMLAAFGLGIIKIEWAINNKGFSSLRILFIPSTKPLAIVEYGMALI